MNMSFVIPLIGFLCLLDLSVSTNHSIKRTKREFETKYLVFPEGSNIQLVYCMTIGTYVKPSGSLSLGVTAGQAWQLPSKSLLSNKFRDYHRRSRRELYRKVELLLGSQGNDGRSCVLKAICDASARSRQEIGKGSFLQEILHAVFTVPDGFSDTESMTDYDRAYLWREKCQEVLDKCPNVF
ncbi:uncharacterized protein LOC117606189 [Osmia lignaria lignaria]|uniref:uncharacterized protein LOC117606189 n=1 Tax=Osmia lignaria lignaria TaxID=1437193 RepID=UPI00402B712B